MSKSYELREAIKTKIVDAGIGLNAGDVVIARQADIFAEIETTVSKASNGVCLVIGASKGRTLNPEDGRLDMDVTLALELWVQPLYDQANKAEEDIADDLMALLHDAILTNLDHCQYRMRVTGWDDIPDRDYLVRRISLQQRIIIN